MVCNLVITYKDSIIIFIKEKFYYLAECLNANTEEY